MSGMSVWSPLPFGDGYCLALVASEQGLEQIRFEGVAPEDTPRDDAFPVLKHAAEQLCAYFAGELKVFDLPLAFRGTEFQKSVWTALLDIPYGETRSYMQIALRVGSPKAVRAVGAANGQNPIPIVVPCHRVIGSNGKLTGFGGGLPLKRFLLDLEAPQKSCY
jgi:methylated-DNA-[protein]-cysteine S-methyltransferase